MDNFKVAIEQFDGPLDLMLHLIKENKLDLFDLDISLLADQYLLYIKKFDVLHLEIASEYLVELATLIEYKSKKLFPKEEADLNDEYEEDPKDRLVRRLLEYQQYKEITSDLQEVYIARQLQFSKSLSIETDEWTKSTSDIPIEGNPYDLFKAIEKCIRRLQLSKPLETRLTKKEVSMEERKLQIIERLVKLPNTFSFERLLDDVKDVESVISTFLAVLDLVRMHTLYFTIDTEDTIWFTRGNS